MLLSTFSDNSERVTADGSWSSITFRPNANASHAGCVLVSFEQNSSPSRDLTGVSSSTDFIASGSARYEDIACSDSVTETFPGDQASNLFAASLRSAPI